MEHVTGTGEDMDKGGEGRERVKKEQGAVVEHVTGTGEDMDKGVEGEERGGEGEERKNREQ